MPSINLIENPLDPKYIITQLAIINCYDDFEFCYSMILDNEEQLKQTNISIEGKSLNIEYENILGYIEEEIKRTSDKNVLLNYITMKYIYLTKNTKSFVCIYDKFSKSLKYGLYDNLEDFMRALEQAFINKNGEV